MKDSPSLNVLLINGYSAANRGDGLLVTLAAELLEEASNGLPVSIIAGVQDPASFDGWNGFEPISVYGATSGMRLAVRGLIALGTRGRFGFSRRYREALLNADVIVSVGGAYHRGASGIELVKSALAHGAQVRMAAHSKKPWILLPQSIGPFPAWYARLIRRWLSRATRVFVRDDTTLRELGVLANVSRVADCAILAVPLATPRDKGQRSDDVALVIRPLPRSGGYEDSLKRLTADKSVTWRPLLQSTISGNDDRGFYSHLGAPWSGVLHEALTDARLSATVSVRLHGALESILEGVPAIHLSYERKGYSAYADLGLHEYVHDARNFDPEVVLKQVSEILADPTDYWSRIDAASAGILSQRNSVVSALREALTGADGSTGVPERV